MEKPNVLFLTTRDPWLPPKGGTSTFAKQMLHVFHQRLAIISASEDETVPIGQWHLRDYNGKPVYYYCLGNHETKNFHRLPFIPRRIVFRRLVGKHIGRFREIGIADLFTDSPESLDILKNFQWDHFCFSLAGLNNPVSFSRYRLLRWLGSLAKRSTVSSLLKLNPDVLLAAADHEAIQEFLARIKHRLPAEKFVSFPTRVNTEVFYPSRIETEKQSLGLRGFPHFVVIGRLHWIKGWDLLLESLKILVDKFPTVRLTFVGDGEDRQKILAKAREMQIEQHIVITGLVPPSQVRVYIGSADLCLMASHREGWSNTMIEVLACGKAIVSTNVSGAKTMVQDGLNGYVVSSRHPVEYAGAIEKALLLPLEFNDTSLRLAQKYAVDTLAEELGRLWKPLS